MTHTPDEIKKAMQGCHSFEMCSLCPYFSLSVTLGCKRRRNADALAYIQQLERERDAAVADICKTCSTCKHYYYNRQDDDTADCLWFDGCKNEDHWEWRGVKEG